MNAKSVLRSVQRIRLLIEIRHIFVMRSDDANKRANKRIDH